MANRWLSFPSPIRSNTEPRAPAFGS